MILGGILPTRPKLVINGSSSSGGGSWAAAQLEVEGSRLYLCQSQGLSGIERRSPLFVYDGVPTDEFRIVFVVASPFHWVPIWLIWECRASMKNGT